MVLIIFTPEGLQQMQQEAVSEQAVLWVNPSLMDTEIVSTLSAELTVHALPEEVNANKEKAVVAALTYVEQHTDDNEILVEYP